MEQPEQLDYHIYKDYEIIQKIGKGTYGVVYKARHKKSNRIIAIKKIIDAFQNVIDAKRTYRELNYLLQIDHPCIVRLEYLLQMNRKGPLHETNTTRLAVPPFSTQQRGSTTDKLFTKLLPQERHVYAVFEFIDTDLACVFAKCNQLQLIQRKYIAYQLLHGIAYLHRSGLVHRDIKPSNILLNSNLQVKICDFGMARLKVVDQNNNDGVLTQYVASRWYRPPQALLGVTTCQDSIDLWSLGCVLAQMALKSPLFPGKSTLDQLQLILKGIGMPTPQQIQKLPSQSSQYVVHNFSFNKRCKFKSLQQTLNNCCSQQIDLIMSLLKFDPTKRITAEQALQHQYFQQIRCMDNRLEHFTNYSTNILDMEITNLAQSQQKGYKTLPGADYYRMLVEQLQKFAQRSTNRSGNVYNNIKKIQGQKEMIIQSKLNDNLSNHNEGFRQKSTKDSDFITFKRHQYCSQKQFIQNQSQGQSKPQDNIVEPSNKFKVDRPKKNISRDILSKTQKISNHSQIYKSQKSEQYKKQSKVGQKPKESSKIIEPRQRSKVTLVHKKQQRQKVKSKIKEGVQIKEKKTNSLTMSDTFLKKYSSKDSKSSIQNNSSSSLHKHSGTKSKSKSKPNLQINSRFKEDHIKKFVKPSLNLNKSSILKTKLQKHSNQFQKYQ